MVNLDSRLVLSLSCIVSNGQLNTHKQNIACWSDVASQLPQDCRVKHKTPLGRFRLARCLRNQILTCKPTS